MISVMFVKATKNAELRDVVTEVALPESPQVGDGLEHSNKAWRVTARSWMTSGGSPHRLIAWVEPIEPEKKK